MVFGTSYCLELHPYDRGIETAGLQRTTGLHLARQILGAWESYESLMVAQRQNVGWKQIVAEDSLASWQPAIGVSPCWRRLS